MKAISVIDEPLINVFVWLTAPTCLPVISLTGVGESAVAPCSFNGSSYVILQDDIEHGVVDVLLTIKKKWCAAFPLCQQSHDFCLNPEWSIY